MENKIKSTFKRDLKEEILYLLKEHPFQELAKMADEVRERFHGNVVHLRAIIEFSNYCRCNCLFCGIRRDNKKLSRYRMTPHEIITRAEKIAKEGFKTIVLQSGEDPFWTKEKLKEIISKIKKIKVAITLSVGERSYEDYATFKDAGADRYLLKFETSDEKLFNALKPDTSLENRLRCLRWLKELGYETGSGIIVGLPAQSFESLAEDLILMKDLRLDMVGIGPFIPHPETPLKNQPAGNPYLTLKVISLTRLLLPLSNIPATTALAVISPSLRIRALRCGANVIMPDMTPSGYKRLYDIYPGKTSVKGSYNELKSLLMKINRFTL